MTKYNPETRQAILSHLIQAREEVAAVEQTMSPQQDDTAHLLQLALEFEKTAEEAVSILKSALTHYNIAIGHETAAESALEGLSSPPKDAVVAGMKGSVAMPVILGSIKRVEEASMSYHVISPAFIKVAEALMQISGRQQDGIIHCNQNLDPPIELLANYDK